MCYCDACKASAPGSRVTYSLPRAFPAVLDEPQGAGALPGVGLSDCA